MFQLNVKENERVTKRSLFVEKQKNFSGQKYIDSQPGKCLKGDGWCCTKHEGTELHGRQTERQFLRFALVFFFFFLINFY